MPSAPAAIGSAFWHRTAKAGRLWVAGCPLAMHERGYAASTIPGGYSVQKQLVWQQSDPADSGRPRPQARACTRGCTGVC